MADPRALRYISFYLPQFHPIPENDQWWGRGFTEWTNVAQATPLFKGHYQPHVPADLGFYDLRLPESRLAQAALARRHGIDAFCYYHYWFEGRRLLHLPFDEVLRSGEPDLDFCLCWANEDWTRVWNGKGGDGALVTQTYSPEDDLQHIRWLAEVFDDHRYLKIGGRPLYLVYRPSRLPDARRTADVWRAEAERLGVGNPYLCAVQSFSDDRRDPVAFGFDAGVQFAPDFRSLNARRGTDTTVRRVTRRFLRPDSPYRANRVHEYGDLVHRMLALPDPGFKRFPCVTPGFDNSPRRRGGGAAIITNSSPEEYRRWLREVVARYRPYSPEENLIFVNAWNEWAEGNHLEPCLRFGTGFLEAHAGVALGT